MMQKEITFAEELSSTLELAKELAKQHNHPNYQVAHVLKVALNRNFSLLKELEAMGVDVYFLEEWADVRLEELPKHMITNDPDMDESIEAVMQEAENVREMLERSELDLFSVMVAIATPGVGFNYDQMKTFPISRAELLNESASVDSSGSFQDMINLPTDRSATTLLYKFCTNKSAQVKKNPPQIVGREKEIKEITEILSRFSKPNVLIQGYPGVGKTSVIDGFIHLINQDQISEKLKGTEVFELEIGSLLAGASFHGEVDDRLKKVLKELRTYPKSILVIDGIHLILNKNSDNAGISSIIKSEIAKGLTIIATTTVDEYTKKIEKDEALANMFEVVNVDEPNDEKAFRILQSAVKSYAKHHELSVEDDSIMEAVELSKRYLKEKSLPESALNLIDRTMSVIKTAGLTFQSEKDDLKEQLERVKAGNSEKELNWYFEDLQQKAHYLLAQEMGEKKELDKDRKVAIKYLDDLLDRLSVIAEQKKKHIEPVDLRAIVAQKTGIPIGKLQRNEKDRLINMEDTLKKRVVGQEIAVKTVTDAIMESRSGLQKAGQPIGSFFFLGPTGTGKTELAKSLAEFLFQDEHAIIRFDMSEFKEEHSAALLYGAPPGYVGYEEGGLLVNKIRQKPYSIVLFDEIEKAHQSVFDVFLQIMDEGKLHDRLGKEGDFSNALILFTSNIGANYIVDSITNGKGHPTSNEMLEVMSGNFRPEFLGRLTQIIPFGPITKENALSIFEIHLKKELYDLLESLNIKLEVTEKAKMQLVDSGFNAAYGARPLKGIIRSELRRPLARKIINGEVSEGQNVIIDIKNDELYWNT